MKNSALQENSLIWFGAAVSIAEIITGTLFAPLGIVRGTIAILLGHVIGCVLLYFAGLAGAKYGKSSMELVKCSFGSKGGIFFAVLNMLQLVGWTAVMIAAGAQSAAGILPLPMWLWSCVIGGLIFLWIAIRSGEFKKLNAAAAVLLFLLSVLLSIVIFRKGQGAVIPADSGLAFGEALELSIAMPLSWLPLIADYTCRSKEPRFTARLSACVYFFGSCWMYLLGLGAALYAGSGDIAVIMSSAGLGIPALLIIIFSTVTTTYLDVYSSTVSFRSITAKVPSLAVGSLVCMLGVLFAVFCNTGDFENFLYGIGSVFAPMIAIQITDFFVLKKTDSGKCGFDFSALAIWGAGFLLYRLFLMWNPLTGSTLPMMFITGFLRFVAMRMQKKCA